MSLLELPAKPTRARADLFPLPASSAHLVLLAHPQASQAASLAGLGPAFGISQLAYKKIQDAGGLNSFLSSLSEDVKNSDITGALNKIKKVGGKEVEPYIAKAEKALKDAGGKAGDVDWKNVLEGLKEEVGDEFKGVVEVSRSLHLSFSFPTHLLTPSLASPAHPQFITQYVPSSGPIVAALATGDFSKITEKIKAEGGESLKDLEATAQKLYKKAEEVSKDGKGNLEDLIKQLKEGESTRTDL